MRTAKIKLSAALVFGVVLCTAIDVLALTKLPSPHGSDQQAVSRSAKPPSLSSAKAAPAPAVAANPAEDIRDIRQPIHIPYPWAWAAYVTAGLAACGLVVALLRWYRRLHPLVVKQPFEIALARLEAARALMTPAQAREFSFAVSEIVRDYIEERFQARAAHLTTEEFLHDLVMASDTLLTGQRLLLADFLQHCDLAKFALWKLSRPEMESMHLSARTFVLHTTPAPSLSKESRAGHRKSARAGRGWLDSAAPGPPEGSLPSVPPMTIQNAIPKP